jgi:hypothetical protein
LVRLTTTLLDRVRNIPSKYIVEDSIGMKWRRLTFDSLPGATVFTENIEAGKEISLH